MDASLDTIWKEIATTALIGTSRRAFDLPGAGECAPQFPELVSDDNESTLLGLAAALSLYRLAGQVPPRDERSLPAPCEPEEQPLCPPRAASLLKIMLGGTHTKMLPEWLELAARENYRAPAETLPQLLDMAQARHGLRAQILPVLGRRGRWLAALNPQWGFALEVAAENAAEIWQTGHENERLAALKTLRAAEPTTARELLAATWAQENSEFRAAVVAVLRQNLAYDDEDFLETALDDRRREVREQAVEMLAQLPQSQFLQTQWSARMWQRAQPLLQWQPGGVLKKPRLKVLLPAECDKAMQRDGVKTNSSANANSSSGGQKAQWLLQIIASVPPRAWCQEWRQTPDTILQAAQKTEWWETLHAAWIEAAVRYRAADWAQALIPHLEANIIAQQPGLLEALPAPSREAYLLELLRREGVSDESLSVLVLYKMAWSEELSREFMQQLQVLALEKTNQAARAMTLYYQLNAALDVFAYLLSPAACSENDIRQAAQSWLGEAEIRPQWVRMIEQFLATLQIRHDMHAAFKYSSET